jgi:bifunctional N-acetylglucosamine-1-phosphate-uridyltransferase/glucosamine-1-phosphate-acetyltransferase GlmU-like protein
LLFGCWPGGKADNAKGEYYLTDVVGLAAGAGCQGRVTFAPEER